MIDAIVDASASVAWLHECSRLTASRSVLGEGGVAGARREALEAQASESILRRAPLAHRVARGARARAHNTLANAHVAAQQLTQVLGAIEAALSVETEAGSLDGAARSRLDERSIASSTSGCARSARSHRD